MRHEQQEPEDRRNRCRLHGQGPGLTHRCGQGANGAVNLLARFREFLCDVGIFPLIRFASRVVGIFYNLTLDRLTTDFQRLETALTHRDLLHE